MEKPEISFTWGPKSSFAQIYAESTRSIKKMQDVTAKLKRIDGAIKQLGTDLNNPNIRPTIPAAFEPFDPEELDILFHPENYLVPAAKLNPLAAPTQKQRKRQRARSVFAWTALILGTIFTLGLIMIAHRPLINWANGRKNKTEI